jgi:glycine cleavage system H protein
MSNVPEEFHYTKEHEWVKQSAGKRFKIGITDFAQGALGDIVYIQLPKIGDLLTQGKVCGEVESTKSVSEIYAPLSGIVTEINSLLDASPELMNSDPYGAGWIFELEVSDENQLTTLLSAEKYRNLTA